MAQENAIFDEQEKIYQDSTEMMNLDELEENLQRKRKNWKSGSSWQCDSSSCVGAVYESGCHHCG